MRVLLAQLCPVAGDAAANAERVADVVAAHPAADLAVFPELFLQGYDLASAPLLALEPDAAEIDRVWLRRPCAAAYSRPTSTNSSASAPSPVTVFRKALPLTTVWLSLFEESTSNRFGVPVAVAPPEIVSAEMPTNVVLVAGPPAIAASNVNSELPALRWPPPSPGVAGSNGLRFAFRYRTNSKSVALGLGFVMTYV